MQTEDTAAVEGLRVRMLSLGMLRHALGLPQKFALGPYAVETVYDGADARNLSYRVTLAGRSIIQRWQAGAEMSALPLLKDLLVHEIDYMQQQYHAPSYHMRAT